MNLKTSVILMSKCGLMFLHERLILLPLCPYPQNLRETPCGQIHCIKLRSHNLGKAAMCQALCQAFPSMSRASPVSWIQPCVQGDPDSRSENQLLTGAHPAPQGLAFPKVSGCLQTDTFIFPSNLQLLFPCCKFSTLVPVCQLKPTWLLH